MGEVVRGLCQIVVSALRSKRDLALENAALRHQLMVLKRQSKAPLIENGDRPFWISLMRLWPDGRSALSLVQPATVVRWHRRGFRAYWRWKTRAKPPSQTCSSTVSFAAECSQRVDSMGIEEVLTAPAAACRTA